MRADEEPVVVQQTYNASAKEVWNAITQPDLMRQWYFNNIPDFKAEVGFETQFDVESESRVFPHKWKVMDVIPGRRIQYTWSYDGFSGDGFVVFEVQEQDGSTQLTLTCTTVEDFPDDIPEFKRENCVAGWEYFIQQSLKSFLDGD